METQFRINWPAIVEEAKQRRKGQKLTQRRLGELAGVSTPTVSRFERGERDIQLSTVTSILGVLGMLDERALTFPDPEPRSNGEAVLFRGRDRELIIRCGISREALEDHFNGDDKDMLKVFNANRTLIEYEARRKYLAGKLERDLSLMIKATDL
jgi:transcriptional regulator with XRE-family HTH domain